MEIFRARHFTCSTARPLCSSSPAATSESSARKASSAASPARGFRTSASRCCAACTPRRPKRSTRSATGGEDRALLDQVALVRMTRRPRTCCSGEPGGNPGDPAADGWPRRLPRPATLFTDTRSGFEGAIGEVPVNNVAVHVTGPGLRRLRARGERKLEVEGRLQRRLRPAPLSAGSASLLSRSSRRPGLGAARGTWSREEPLVPHRRRGRSVVQPAARRRPGRDRPEHHANAEYLTRTFPTTRRRRHRRARRRDHHRLLRQARPGRVAIGDAVAVVELSLLDQTSSS